VRPDGAEFEEVGDLAELLADQLANLGDDRPVDPRAERHGDKLFFTFDWPYGLWEQQLVELDRESQVRSFRVAFLRVAARSLVEVVEICCGRHVDRASVKVAADGGAAGCWFLLGAELVVGELVAPGVDPQDIRGILARCRRQVAQAGKMQVAARAQVLESEALLDDARSLMAYAARRKRGEGPEGDGPDPRRARFLP
jgi:hypothetical protein